MTRLKAKVLTVAIIVLAIAGLCTSIAFAAGAISDGNVLAAQSEAVSGNYAVLEENDDTLEGGGQAYTLTFKYAEEEVTPDAVAVYTGYENGFANKDDQLWKEYRDSVTKVSFDESVQNHLEPASMSHWFYGLTNLTSVDGMERINAVNQNSNGPASMFGMFENCTSIKSLVIPFKISDYHNRAGNMQSMFNGCSSLETLDISALDTRAAAANVVYRTDANGNNVPYYNGLTDMLKGANSLSSLSLGSNTQLTSDCGLLVPGDIFPYTGKWGSDGKGSVTTDGLVELSTTSGAAAGIWTLETTSDTSGFAYAILYDDGEMVFQRGNDVDENHIVLGGPWCIGENVSYSSLPTGEKVPWGPVSDGYSTSSGEYAPQVKNIVFKDRIAPVSLYDWFAFMRNLETVDLENLDTSRVTNMQETFFGCSSVTNLDLSTFNTANVTSMDGMFNGCRNLESINLSSFETANVNYMNRLFSGCTNLKTIDMSNFDTRKSGTAFSYTNSNGELQYADKMQQAFQGTSSLKTLILGENTVLGQDCALSLSDGEFPYTGKWVAEGHSAVSSDELIVLSATSGSATGTWTAETTSDATKYAFAVLYADGEMVFQRGDATEPDRTVTKIMPVSESGSFENEMQVPWREHCWSIRSVSFKDEISPVSIAYWFSGLANLESFNYANLNTSNTTSMRKAFAGIRTSSLDLSSLNTSSVTDMSGMFSTATVDNLNLSALSTSNVTNMREMFFYAQISELNLSNFDTSNVTNMATMFDGCSVKTLDISSFDTALARSSVDPVSNGTGVEMMFSYTDNLSSLKLGQNTILTGASLPNATYADGSDVKWTGPNGQSFTSEELMAQYDGSSNMVGVWTRVAPLRLEKATIDIPANPRYVSGLSLDLNESVTLDGVTLTRGTDYTIEFVEGEGSSEVVTPSGPGYYCVHFSGSGIYVGDQWKWVLLIDENGIAGAVPDAVPVYKLYEASAARWAYTINETEAASLAENGWESAGVAFYEYAEAAESRVPMYCVYNPTTHEYFYTQSIYERDHIIQDLGWEDRGIAWYMDERDSAPVYRMYYFQEGENQGLHYYTTSSDEVDGLKTRGWLYEGVGWYAVSAGTSTLSPLNANDISSAQVSGIADVSYTGEAQTQNATVTLNGRNLVAGTDYTVEYANNTNAGTATVTITGTGSYTGEITRTFTISPAEITEAVAEGSPFTYDGTAKTPSVTVKAGSLDVPTDAYDVAYANNTNAGTASATITAKENGNYVGSKTIDFAIGKATIDSVAFKESSFTYDGAAQTPFVTVKAGSLDVPADAYDVAYADNTSAGTATATVMAKENGNYTGSKAAEFTISPLDISNSSVSASFDISQTVGLVYENGEYSIEYQGAGTPIVPVPVLSFGGGNLVANTDYAVSYSDNVNPGMATVTVSGEGNFTGERVITFNILTPKKTETVGDGNGDVKSVTAEGMTLVDEKPEGEKSTVELVVQERADEDAQALKAEVSSGKENIAFSSVVDVKLEAVTKSDSGQELDRKEIKDDIALTLTFDVSKGGTQINGKLALIVHMHDGIEAGREVQPVVDGTVTITVSKLSDFVIVVQNDAFDSNIANAAIAWPDLSTYAYDGTAKEPKPTSITANGETLAEGTKYEVAYEANTNAGTATATVTGKGTYSGTVTKTFSIAKRPVTVTAKSAEKVYDGSALTAAAVGYEASGLVKASDIASVVLSGSVTDAGSSASKVGAVTFADGMESNYELTKVDGTLKVTPAPITGVTFSSSSFTYNGSQQRPSVTARWTGGTVPASGYDVSWPSDTTNPGKKTVTVAGKGNFAGTASAEYAIAEGAQQPAEEEPAPEPEQTPEAARVSMHRLYNPNSGEHFYTASDAERDHLVSVGWNSEGEGWTAPEKSNTPVYRMYNPNAGEHHYTMSEAERDMLVSVGWNYESIGWYSDDEQRTPLYRDYNPNAFANNHNYTTSAAEHEMLMGVGWNSEGYAWYGM